MNILQDDKQYFAPFSIRIESEAEMQYMWHCLNQPAESIKKLVSDGDKARVPFPDPTPDQAMWEVLDDYMVEEGYRI